MAAVNLTSGAISKIMTGKCTQNDDLKPVLQVTSTLQEDSGLIINGKQWCLVLLSDSSFEQFGLISDELFISKNLQEGSIVQLTKFQIYNISTSFIRVCDLKLLRSKCDIIGDPKLYALNKTSLVERTTNTIPDEDHANSHHVEEPPTSKQKPDHVDSNLNENIDDSRHVEEPSTSIQIPWTSRQECSSRSPTQNKKRKLQLSDDIISGFGKDISKLVSGLGVCCKKLGTLEEGVSKMMEKNKEVNVGFEKLKTLEENVSKLTRMIMEKNKEDDVGACVKKLKTLEENVSKLTRMIMEKNKEDVMSFKKLDTLEEHVSKMTKLMTEKSKEADVGFKKLETLEEDVSKLTRMMTEKNKEDDMGACIEKLDKIGWVAQDPMYDTALLLFGQSVDYRRLWLHLKPESCGNWVKNAGSMVGLLD